MLEVFADFAELSRNRPAGEERHPRTRCTARGSTSTPTCRASTPTAARLPDDFRDKLAAGAAALRRDRPRPHARARARPSSGSSWPSSARPPTSQLATSILQRWIGRAAARRRRSTRPPATSSTGSSSRPSCASRSSATSPAASASAGSTSRWSTQERAERPRRRGRDQLVALAAMPDGRRPGTPPSTRSPPSPSRSCGSSPSGSTRRHRCPPEHEPMLEVLIKRHYREHELHGLHDLRRRRPALRRAPTTPLDDRPTHLVSTVGRVDELAPGSALVAAVSADEIASAAAGHRSRRRPLPVAGPRSPSTPTRPPSASIADRLAGLALRPGRAPRHRRRLPRRRPPGRLLHLPPQLGADDPVGGPASSAACTRWSARRLNLWRLRDVRRDPARGPRGRAALRCVAPDNPADQRLVALAQVRQLVVVRDEAGQVIGLPHAERAIANCLEAIRRVRAAPRCRRCTGCDMNHVWVSHLADHRGRPRAADRAAGPDRADDRRRRHRGGAGRRHGRRLPDGAALPIAAPASTTSPAPGSSTTLGAPPTERLKPLDDYAQKVVRARRRGVVYPYELQAMIAGPTAAPSSSTTSTTRARSCRSTGRTVSTRPASSSGVISLADRSLPRGRAPGSLLCGDPLRALGAVAEAECARVIAALDLAERMQVPVEWYRPLGRRPDLDGLRHREHGLGRPGPEADRRVHPGRAARSTSSSPASTSAPSPTGTPRRPC